MSASNARTMSAVEFSAALARIAAGLSPREAPAGSAGGGGPLDDGTTAPPLPLPADPVDARKLSKEDFAARLAVLTGRGIW